MKKLVVILGPTAAGKTDLSIALAKKFKGEVVSADSRQVYKGMDIGTGKITKKEMQGVPHYLLDVASPKRKFTIAQFKKRALRAIRKIQRRGKIPFLVGGTAFYIQTIIDGIKIPKVKPDWKLRKRLEKKTPQQLFSLLQKKDPRRAKDIDRHNKRRLIRALEIVHKTRRPVPLIEKSPPQWSVLVLGVKRGPEELKKRIKKRLKRELRKGVTAEIKRLRGSGLSWKRLESFGLEYRWIAKYLQEKISREEMEERLQKDIEHFAKRQMTWFKKEKRIHWVRNQKEAEELVKEFLRR